MEKGCNCDNKRNTSMSEVENCIANNMSYLLLVPSSQQDSQRQQQAQVRLRQLRSQS